MHLKKILPLLFAVLAMPFFMMGQVTTSSVSGIIKDQKGQPLMGASVIFTHVPTGTVYSTASRKNGIYSISNMNPGGPYKVETSFVGFNTSSEEIASLSLGEALNYDVVLTDKSGNLTEVAVTGTRALATKNAGGAGTNIGRDKMANLPTISRNIQDFVRFVPQAKLTNADGGISIAGQNNRYNSFYIDGAASNDQFGLAASGTNGGQTGASPISIDAIDQLQVMISPYDASIGNFTGGGINAITKSGTNNFNGSVYYVFRNQALAGVSPQKTLVPGSTTEYERTKLPDFTNQTMGIRIGGPLVKNKLFYFLLAELQRDERPQPFNFSNYTGTTNRTSAIDSLSTFLQTKFAYDPGTYLDNPEKVEADRYVGKIDWNVNNRNKLSVSYRYNKSFRNNTTASSSTRINFSNNGFIIPNTTQTLALEFRSAFKNRSNNRFLFTVTDVKDDRGPLGQPFPRVTLNDGSGQIIFGTDNSSTQNLLKTTNYVLQDSYTMNVGKHALTFGTDNELTTAYNVFIQNSFGNYTFNASGSGASALTALQNFYNNAGNGIVSSTTGPGYVRGIALLDGKADDETESAAEFNVGRIGFFINDELKANQNLTFNFGIRADKTNFVTDPKVDEFFNDSASVVLSQYWDLKGAKSGQKPTIPIAISPRIGFVYKIPSEKIVVRGGLGYFTGRIPLVWPGGIYNNNGISVGAIQRNTSNALLFRADPYGQYTPADFGLNPNRDAKGSLNLIAKEFRLTKIFRTSLAVDKDLGKNWSTSFELIVTKNINEINYQNVNIYPNRFKAVGADTRAVNDTINASSTASSVTLPIPIRTTGVKNPYTDVLILQNATGQKGFSYVFTFTVNRAWKNGFAFNANYAYGNSQVLNEGTSSVNTSQYRFMEAVNGQNNLTLSTSDFDGASRITAYFAKKFSYAKNKISTTVSMTYQGQSGSPFSFVYQNSMVKAINRTETNDLIFVPTQAQLQNMIFSPNTVSGVTYTEQQQRDLFNDYIENNEYLSKRRGQYAERNGDRLPFTNLLNLQIKQEFVVNLGKRSYGLELTYDVFNLANMFDADAGRQYFLLNDQYALLRFNGFVSSTNLTPRYQFSPQTANGGNPYGISTSTQPDYSARWISAITARINF